MADAAAPRTVLYIDEGISFGGSLVVTAHLVRHLDPARYRAVVVAESSPQLLERLFPGAAARHVIRRRFNYTHWDRVRPGIRKLPFGWLRSAASLACTLWAGLLNVPYYVRLRRVVRDEGVDLIHHGNGATNLAMTLLGPPLMATMAGIKTTRYSPVQRLALRRMRRFVMISRAVRQAYLAHGGREEIAVTIPNPCDPRPLDARGREEVCRRWDLAPDEKRFAIFGRVVHWKGQKEFARAALRVLDRVPEACALVVGSAADGGEGYLDEVRAIVDSSPHRERVRFLGYVADVHELYNVVHVAVHASTVPEPFGLVVIEAMSYGLPIVAADAGGPTELIEEGVDGYLVDPRDTARLAHRIERLLRDDELRARVGEAGRAKAQRSFDARVYARRLQSIYDEITWPARNTSRRRY